MGSAGAITSLVSYPALLALGLSPLSANVTNAAALIACWPGSALASRPELAGRRSWLLPWMALASVSGAVGAVLLLSTPAHTFARVVPFLVLGTVAALLLEPRISVWLELSGRQLSRGALAAALVAVCLYSGYFGAGSGVMTLALVLIFVDRRLAHANALKNMLVGAATLVPGFMFICFGPVRASATIPLAAGMFCGSRLGPGLVRLVSPRVLRMAIAVLGVVLAVELWINP